MKTQWETLPTGLRRRIYPSYDAYVVHQAQKLARMSPLRLQKHDARLSGALRGRLRSAPWLWSPDLQVLCLGARTGAEVQVFRALGCRAIGLDLNPGPGNPDVLRGDFHSLPFPDQTFGAVFTNALDHAYDLAAVLAEVARVLVQTGIFWIEAVRGTAEGCAVGAFESLAWSTLDDLLPLLTHGFICRHRIAFDCPWPGEALVCQR